MTQMKFQREEMCKYKRDIPDSLCKFLLGAEYIFLLSS